MKLFLTSSIGGSYKENGKRYPTMLDGSNDFVELLKSMWKEEMSCLLIAAAPADYETNDSIASIFQTAFMLSGVPLSHIDICDNRRAGITAQELANYGIIILCGGHVPTQNAYFHTIGLSEKIEDYDGIVIGYSAGSMNCANLVYAMPELDGESLNPDYKRFILGLGISDHIIIPHFGFLKGEWLDGKRCIEDIALPDSEGKEFIALTDGSYIFVENGKSVLHGEAYLLRNGSIRPLCEHGQYVELH